MVTYYIVGVYCSLIPFGMSNQGIGSTPTSVPAATTGGKRSTGNPSWSNRSSFHYEMNKSSNFIREME